MKLFLNASDLPACQFALLWIHFHGRRAGQPLLRAVHDGGHYFQVAQQFGGCGGGGIPCLPLRFEKQLRRIQDALADGGRSLAPGGIQSAGVARIAVMLGEDRRHPLAVL